MNILTFDIETIPCQLPGIKEEFAQQVTAPAQYKKPESIAEWLRENRESEAESQWLKTSFDGGMGQCIAIGYAVDDEPARCLYVEDTSREAEAAILSDFFSVVSEAGSGKKLVGHNIIGFDLPFLWKRAMVLNVKPPFFFPRNPKPWSDMVCDTMLMWDATQRAGGSMDRLCRLLGIPGKDGMDGSQVWPYFQTGRHQEIASYCQGDVERTRAMYQRMSFSLAA